MVEKPINKQTDSPKTKEPHGDQVIMVLKKFKRFLKRLSSEGFSGWVNVYIKDGNIEEWEKVEKIDGDAIPRKQAKGS